MAANVVRAIVLVVGQKTYYYQGGYEDWRRVRGRKVDKPLFQSAPRIHLPRQTTVEVISKGALVRATLRLTPPYHRHARWFAGNPMVSPERYLSQVAPSHLRGWLHYAIMEDKPLEESTAEFISRLDPAGIILPGRIYRVTRLEVHAVVDPATGQLAGKGA